VHVLANVSTNQDAFHAKYGGIVPDNREPSSASAAVGGDRRRA